MNGLERQQHHRNDQQPANQTFHARPLFRIE
jgi:hypothetical protein